MAIPLLLYIQAQHWCDFETQYVLDKYFLPLFSLHKKYKYVRGKVREPRSAEYGILLS